jgi:ADP-ribosylglycohydrolase
MVACRDKQGHDVRGLQTELLHLPDSYDAFAEFVRKLDRCPLRADWPHVEPDDWETIRNEAPQFPTARMGTLAPEQACARAEAAFDAAVAGCMLGKPLEVDPTLDELQKAAEPLGEWPLRDYVSIALLERLGRRHGSWPTTCRDNIRFVTPDDDINYDVIALLVLERHGLAFTRRQLMDLWLHNLPVCYTWGPERTALLKAGTLSIHGIDDGALAGIPLSWNPADEACGAAIRDDPYGYACPGLPGLAAELAWRDAGMTHRRTGIYGSMYIAAAIAAAPVAHKPFDIFETAIRCLPQRTRFAQAMRDCFEMVAKANDWIEGYRCINAKYGEHRHCQLYQECGQLINTARFAKDAGEAICMQVMQGCDTDCFGEIAGSIMGAYFGPGSLDERWLKPLNDDFRCSLGDFHERSLAAVRKRMGALPELTAGLK